MFLSAAVFLSMLSWSATGLQVYQKQLQRVQAVISQHNYRAGPSSHATTPLPRRPSITNYTSYMHIHTIDGNDPLNNWNATLVEYFTLYPNGDSHARDDNFYISLGNGIVQEDSVQWNFCYADLPDQDTYVVTYPTNPAQQMCIPGTEPNYDQGCISYFANLPNAPYKGSCISPYSDEEGDSYVMDYPGIVYLEYCLKKDSLTIPHYFKSIINNVTMMVIFSLFNDYAPPEKVYSIPEICNKKE